MSVTSERLASYLDYESYYYYCVSCTILHMPYLQLILVVLWLKLCIGASDPLVD